MRYKTRFIHKISPSEKDVGPDVELSPLDLQDRRKLGAVLRRARVLQAGQSIADYRIETNKIVVFPKETAGSTTGWWSIILTLA
jgi:hypothetical protein